MLKLNSSQSNDCTHTVTENTANFKQTSDCQKADGNCFLGQERSDDDDGIHAKMDHNHVRRALRVKR
jgi:hypothetical protein